MSRIATFSGFQSNSTAKPFDEENTYFAGGERSGVAIQGPPQNKPTNRTLVDDILKQAAQYAYL
jgi:UBX domain-containing protein 1